MPSNGNPAVVPAVDVSAGDQVSFLAERMRNLRDVKIAVLPLVTRRESMSQSEVNSLKGEIAGELLRGPGGWTPDEVQGLFERLHFGDSRLVITAGIMHYNGQDWGDPSQLMDTRVLQGLIRQRAARFLGLPVRKVSVSFFTADPSGYTLADGLEGFKILLILSIGAVKDVTGGFGTMMKAFERSGQSA